MITLVFATNNQHKLKEVRSMLPEWIHIKSLKDIGCEEDLPETGKTFQANALQKARYISEKYGLNCMADDSGLEVEALGGEPGVYSARYAGAKATSSANILKLLHAMKGESNRKAKFTAVIALIIAGDVNYFEGTINGHITETENGSSGFGYDPIFIPECHTKTFAEMSQQEKNSMSHRANAITLMAEWIKVNLLD